MTKRDRLVKQLGITDADISEIKSAAWQVWTDVAYDLLTAIAEEKGKHVNDVEVRRSLVIETVLDADRLHERLRRRNGIVALTAEGRLMMSAQYDRGPARDLLAILMKETFPYRTYGM